MYVENDSSPGVAKDVEVLQLANELAIRVEKLRDWVVPVMASAVFYVSG
jgi:hypothetical protein